MKSLKNCILVSFLFVTIPIASGRAQSESHVAAADEFFEVMNMLDMISKMIPVMLDAEIAGNPALAQFREVMEQFFERYFTWDSLRPEYVRIYAEAFTEGELRELAVFYRTDVGQKAISVLPALMQQGAVVGQAMVERHQPELIRMVQERVAEAQRDSTKSVSR